MPADTAAGGIFFDDIFGKGRCGPLFPGSAAFLCLYGWQGPCPKVRAHPFSRRRSAWNGHQMYYECYKSGGPPIVERLVLVGLLYPAMPCDGCDGPVLFIEDVDLIVYITAVDGPLNATISLSKKKYRSVGLALPRHVACQSVRTAALIATVVGCGLQLRAINPHSFATDKCSRVPKLQTANVGLVGCALIRKETGRASGLWAPSAVDLGFVAMCQHSAARIYDVLNTVASNHARAFFVATRQPWLFYLVSFFVLAYSFWHIPEACRLQSMMPTAVAMRIPLCDFTVYSLCV